MDTDGLRTWFSGTAVPIGAWLIASPLAFGAPEALQWSNVATGAAITALAAFAA